MNCPRRHRATNHRLTTWRVRNFTARIGVGVGEDAVKIVSTGLPKP
jgi:hypothetical protein